MVETYVVDALCRERRVAGNDKVTVLQGRQRRHDAGQVVVKVGRKPERGRHRGHDGRDLVHVSGPGCGSGAYQLVGLGKVGVGDMELVPRDSIHGGVVEQNLRPVSLGWGRLSGTVQSAASVSLFMERIEL